MAAAAEELEQQGHECLVLQPARTHSMGTNLSPCNGVLAGFDGELFIRSPREQAGVARVPACGVSIPLALSGRFDAIDWKIQWPTVVTAAVQHKLKDELSERLSQKLGVRLSLPPMAGDPPATPVTPQGLLRGRLRGLLR